MDKDKNIGLLSRSLNYSYFDKSQYAQNSEAIDIVKYLFSKGYEQQDVLYLISEMVMCVKNKSDITVSVSKNANLKSKIKSQVSVKILESDCDWFLNS